jgi:hypothetical protein
MENVLDHAVDAPPNFNRFDLTVRTPSRPADEMLPWVLVAARRRWEIKRYPSTIPLFGVYPCRYNLQFVTLVHKKLIRNYEMGPRSSERMTPALVIKGTPL